MERAVGMGIVIVIAAGIALWLRLDREQKREWSTTAIAILLFGSLLFGLSYCQTGGKRAPCDPDGLPVRLSECP